MDKDAIVKNVMSIAPVIPVLSVNSVDDAVALSRALVAGGLPSIEVTLRTPCAIEAIRAIGEQVEGAIVGAGSVITSGQVAAVEKAGAKFMVSPGFSPNLLDAVQDSPLPLLPGIANASQAMHLAERGYAYLKFFPAGPSGGPDYLKSLGGPLPQFRFCPTGGINQKNAGDYLRIFNVLCVGGSWVAPPLLVENGAWGKITQLARDAAKLSNEIA